MKNYSYLIIFFVVILIFISGKVQSVPFYGCNAKIEGDKLIVENNKIRREFRWNSGNLITTLLENKSTKQVWLTTDTVPNFVIPGAGEASEGKLTLFEIQGTNRISAHLKAEIEVKFKKITLKRVFRIYPDCPAIACDIYLKGTAPDEWKKSETSVNALKNYEMHGKEVITTANVPIIDRLNLPGKHWQLSAVDFFDNTDTQNTLVNKRDILAYNGFNCLKGNLLFANDQLSGSGIFILKEAPCSNIQLAYPGFDFFCKIGEFQTVGLGLQPEDLGLFANEWVQAYSFVAGVTDGTEFGQISALRTYYQNARLFNPQRDDMILMNSWGDRNGARKLNEQFCLTEIEACNRLGITHYQIDYGWSQGNAPYSEGYYLVNQKRFPNGLQPLIKRAKELEMTVGIYGNPGPDNYPYLHWKEFGDAFINVYKETGINLIKFDLFRMTDKLADINVKRIMQRINEGTNNEAFFNIDISFQDRPGYFYCYEFGNYFLENRYTDWVSYYPHWTLRNLWMLSRYVPSYMLQTEFLNKWRNNDKYPMNDPFKPSQIPFDYIFATTMAGQPLAWFEASGLPDEAFEIAPLVKKYKENMAKIHQGQVFPIGNEPSGKSWTGFQSVNGNKGYLIVYRENNDNAKYLVKTWFGRGQKVKCKAIAGHGKDFTYRVNDRNEIEFSLPNENSFALYEYDVID